jgi:hypothetical protein
MQAAERVLQLSAKVKVQTRHGFHKPMFHHGHCSFRRSHRFEHRMMKWLYCRTCAQSFWAHNEGQQRKQQKGG